jgi:hypothetical protein
MNHSIPCDNYSLSLTHSFIRSHIKLHCSSHHARWDQQSSSECTVPNRQSCALYFNTVIRSFLSHHPRFIRPRTQLLTKALFIIKLPKAFFLGSRSLLTAPPNVIVAGVSSGSILPLSCCNLCLTWCAVLNSNFDINCYRDEMFMFYFTGKWQKSWCKITTILINVLTPGVTKEDEFSRKSKAKTKESNRLITSNLMTLAKCVWNHLFSLN